ncbi:MAG: Ig-like domain-containing protein [Methylophilus sp.]
MQKITAQQGGAAYSILGLGVKARKAVANILIVTLLVLDIPVPMTMATAQAADIPASQWVTVPVKTDPMMQGLNIPANAATQGMWSPIYNWPMNGLHSMVLPDGKVLTFGTTANGNNQDGRLYDVWDPSLGFGTNSHNSSYQAQQQDSFCATATYLNDGRLLVTGGNANNGGYGNGSTIFNPVDNTRVTAPASTALPRWYATMITLPDSRKIILGGMKPYTEGMYNNPDQAIANGDPSMTPEIYENGAWRSLFGANSRDAFGPDFLRTSFPHAFVAPNGQVFGISADKMWYLDANANGANGAITYVDNFKRGYGNMADPVNVGALSVAVMYDIGKIIQVGGNGGFNGDGYPSSNMATMFDINNGTPVLTELPRMNFARRYGNGIVLANGQVVITGGTRFGNDGGGNAVYAAEIWNPDTGNWSVGANANTIRVYHSITSLLPNGAILSTGGGTPGPVLNLNAEVYYPPYLFKQAGGASQLAVRPVIKAISGLSYNHNDTLQLDMGTADPIASLALIGLSNGTHTFNAGQRRIPLSFTQNSIRLTTTIPNANLTPPGYYQVVALDASGVPSYGAIVAIGQNVTAPNIPVTPYLPPDLSGTINVPVISAGGTANYTTTAISGYTYSWNFGDGTPSTAYSTNPSATHVYAQPGAYVVTLAAKDGNGIISYKTYMQAVATTKTAQSPRNSSPIITEPNGRIWTVNPDNDSVSVIGTNNALIREIAVGKSPRTLAYATNGYVWVTNKESNSVSWINTSDFSVTNVALPYGSQPHGIVISQDNQFAYIALEATGQVIKLRVSDGVQIGVINVGANPRHLAMSADSTKLLISRFITPPLPGESTANIDTSTKGGEVIVVNAESMTINKTITLRHSDKVDNSTQGSGVPNYLAAPVISPDGTTAWVPSKQDNIKRGIARSGQNLDFQNTVRAISSRIDMEALAEDYAKRIDHDNSSVGSAAAYHPSGVYLFVALESSRQVAVVDAIRGSELFRIEVGLAPQGLAVSTDGNTLYVQEFMDRSVSVFDLSPLTTRGLLTAAETKVVYTVATEKLPAQVVLGKQLFYDAKDSRLARDSYMSCASCHNDGSHDGRVWDITGFGEGLRNTISLKGRAATGHGFLHWSANFDELQDFEKQIRDLAGGTGLMADADYNAGTRNQALGDKKAGLSVSLDDLAAYVTSLNTFAQTPYRNADGTLTASASAGKVVFNNTCASCHAGNAFTVSSDASNLKNVGTINSLSGQRLGGSLTGIDVPTLRDVWATAPYLHNGSAPTINAAVQAHNNIALNETDLANVVTYVQQIGGEEIVKSAQGTWKFDEGVGTTVVDSSGNNHPLTLTNTTWVAGQFGQAAKFNGTNASAQTAGSNVDTSQSFSVSAWVKLDNLNGWQTIVNQDGANVSGFWLQYSQYVNNNKFMLTMHDVDSTNSIAYRAVSTTTPVVGQWYHIVGVRDKAVGTMKIYVNGKLEGTTQYTGGWASNGTLNVGRGKWGGANDWVAGAIDEVNVFGYAVSDKEVTQLYQGNITPPANVAPTVSLTAPANNASYIQGSAVTITANAADSDGTVAKVEFYDGATLINADTTAPYSYTWANAAVGTHAVTAKVYDNSGATTISGTVNIVVNASTNIPPANAITCANENGTCTIPTGSIATVWYGANTSWAVKTGITGSIGCDNATFGDPINGTVKTCQYQITSAPANVAPTVSLTAPANNAAYTQGTAIAITANAADSDGTVAKVEFYDGATLINTDTAAPYTYNWANAAVGTHTITAKATDNAGAVTASAAITVVVNAPVNVAPTVSITAPANNATYIQGTGITLTANAADTDGTVAKVEFYDGATLLGTSTAAPYTYIWANAAVGTHTITAKATDNSGAVTTSAAVNVTVNAPTTSNLASTATLATSYVSAWESLAAVKDGYTPANSTDHSHGAYGNWNGTANYGKTNWVSFTWSTAKKLSAFEVYWWNDGAGIATPTSATVQYWDGAKWVSLGSIGRSLNTFNKLAMNITTTSIRVSMSSTRATGIIEARVSGY